MNCQNHAQQEAHYHCTKCDGYFCDECTTVRKISEEFTAYICKTCGGKAEPKGLSSISKKVPPKEKENKHQERSAPVVFKQGEKAQRAAERSDANFWFSALSIPFYPFRRKGIFILLLMTLLFFGLLKFSEIMPILALIAQIILTTYFAVYLLKIMDESAQGSVVIASFMNLNYWIEVILPFLYVVLAVVIAFGPAHLYLFFAQSFDWTYAALFGVGLFLFPMFSMKALLFKSISSVNPITALVSIFKSSVAYIFLVAVTAALGFLYYWVDGEYITHYLASYEQIQRVLEIFILVYFSFVVARLWGIFLLCYRPRI